MSSGSSNLAEVLRQNMEQEHGPALWQTMWDLMLRITSTRSSNKRWLWEFMKVDQVRCDCVWAPGNVESAQSLPVTADECSWWWPVLVSTDPVYVGGLLFPVLCKPLLEGGCRSPWMTHRDRIVFLQVEVASPPAEGPPPARPSPVPGPQGPPAPPTRTRDASPFTPSSSSTTFSTACFTVEPQFFETMD